MSPLRKELEKYLKEMCQEMGFKKAKYTYYRQINDDFIANVMFPCASYQVKHHILVACAVGITSISVENIIRQCAELTYLKEYDSTIQTNIGYIAPQNHYMEWDCSEQTCTSILFKDIQTTIEKYAYPFFNRYSNLGSLERSILNGEFHTTTDRDILLAIIAYLREDKVLAQGYLDKFVKKRQDKRGPDNIFASILEERFDRNFRELLL